MKWTLYIFFGLLYAVVSFFGIGPILMADGSMQERLFTLLTVVVIYTVLTLLFRWLLKRISRKS
jgi:hypothetical protein